jgi:hypothetical protein
MGRPVCNAVVCRKAAAKSAARIDGVLLDAVHRLQAVFQQQWCSRGFDARLQNSDGAGFKPMHLRRFEPSVEH